MTGHASAPPSTFSSPSKDLLELALESSEQGIWEWKLDKNEIYFSPTWKKLIGYKDSEILNIPETWMGRVHNQDLNKLNDAIEAHRRNLTDHFICDYRLRHRDGSYRWMLGRGKIHVSPEHGKRFIGLHWDVTGQKRFEEQSRYDALHDSLTGLPNRVLFMERLNQAVRRSKRDKNFKFAVLFLDLDGLKKINDTLGHGAGDILLTTFAKDLKAACREVDTVCRLGGDEFTIIQPDIEDIQDVHTFAERIIATACKPLQVGEKSIQPSVSIGISTNLEWTRDARELLRDADLALYHAKSQEGPHFSFFEEEMKNDFRSQFHMGIGLQGALKKKELILHYQPIFNLATGQIVGAEALIRWHHPHFGLISPLDFIPLAEDTDIIFDIGKWVLEEASRQLNTWMQSQNRAHQLTMNVNVSGRQLDKADFVEDLAAILQNYNFPPHHLQIELTESVLSRDPNTYKIQLSKLKDLGVGLALDDFGTGYSSLNLLHQYTFDCIKIDRDFVNHIDIKEKTQKTVTSIIHLAREIGCSTIAEGIETKAEQDKLRELGCDFGQGFVLSRALPAPEFEATCRQLGFFK